VGKVTLTIEAASLQEAVDLLRAELPNARMAAYATGPGMNPDDTYAAMTGRDPKPPAPSVMEVESAPTSTTPVPATPAENVGESYLGGAPAAPETGPVPPASTAASATGARSPAALAPSTSTELDADGLPWDDRIHAGSQTKLAKTGQWKKKRGVEDELVRQVEAELRLLMAVPSPAATPSVFAESDAAAAFTAPMPPVPPATAPEFAPPATLGAVTPTSGIRTMAELTKAIIAAGLDMQTDVLPVLQSNGVQSLPLLGARSDLIPAIAAQLFGG
jgi:hypothetical protein